jgi:hypothetical protein
MLYECSDHWISSHAWFRKGPPAKCEPGLRWSLKWCGADPASGSTNEMGRRKDGSGDCCGREVVDRTVLAVVVYGTARPSGGEMLGGPCRRRRGGRRTGRVARPPESVGAVSTGRQDRAGYPVRPPCLSARPKATPSRDEPHCTAPSRTNATAGRQQPQQPQQPRQATPRLSRLMGSLDHMPSSAVRAVRTYTWSGFAADRLCRRSQCGPGAGGSHRRRGY